MSNIILKFALFVVFVGVFVLVVFQVPYPETITQANLTQLSAFFIPLFLAIIFSLNILLGNILISVSISLGIIFLLLLKSFNSLNTVTGIIILIAVGLLISYFKKAGKKGLTKHLKIPKLTSLRRQK